MRTPRKSANAEWPESMRIPAYPGSVNQNAKTRMPFLFTLPHHSMPKDLKVAHSGGVKMCSCFWKASTKPVYGLSARIRAVYGARTSYSAWYGEAASTHTSMHTNTHFHAH